MGCNPALLSLYLKIPISSDCGLIQYRRVSSNRNKQLTSQRSSKLIANIADFTPYALRHFYRVFLYQCGHHRPKPCQRHHFQLTHLENELKAGYCAYKTAASRSQVNLIMSDTMEKGVLHGTEALGASETHNTYREGAIAGEGGETKRGLKSRHIQFL